MQPGLVKRLIRPPTLNKDGYYSVWLNINGVWEETLIDDYMLFYKSLEGQTKLFNCSPYHATNEVWHLILEKAIIKRYGGYYYI